MIFKREHLEKAGFEGFLKIGFLKSDGCKSIPKQQGVYVVIRENLYAPSFLEKSIGGHFKGEDPTVEIQELNNRWVNDAYVLYIGKAGGNESKATLQSRLKQYIDFGKGKPVGHKGGRYIWQLQGCDELLIAWKPEIESEPRDVEAKLIQEFKSIYGKRPLANLVD